MQDMGEAMPDYEILELILCLAVPRGDVKPLAKALLHKFKDFTGVLNARPGMLEAVEGIGPAAITAIKLMNSAAGRMLKQRMTKSGHIVSSWDELLDYLQVLLGRDTVERLVLVFLNASFHVIDVEIHQKGTLDHTPLYPREIVKRAIDIGASGLVMAHNHPSGQVKPSKADVEITQRLKSTLAGINIKLHDHVIIGDGAYYSFKNRGLF